MKTEIKCCLTGKVLFEHTAEGNTTRLTLEAAVADGAYLDGANLAGDEYKDYDHGLEYRAALAMIDAHVEIWTPAPLDCRVMP